MFKSVFYTCWIFFCKKKYEKVNFSHEFKDFRQWDTRMAKEALQWESFDDFLSPMANICQLKNIIVRNLIFRFIFRS